MKDYRESATTFERAGYSEYAGPSRAPTLATDAWPAIVQGLFVGVLGGGILAGGTAAIGGAWYVAWPLCAGVLSIGVWYWRQGVYDDTLAESQRRDTRPVTVQRVDMGEPGHVLVNAARGRDALAVQNAERGRREFCEFIRGCEAGPRTLAFWEPKIGRKKYRAWRDELVDAGFAEREGAHENAPWHLTTTAAEIVAALDAGQ